MAWAAVFVREHREQAEAMRALPKHDDATVAPWPPRHLTIDEAALRRELRRWAHELTGQHDAMTAVVSARILALLRPATADPHATTLFADGSVSPPR